jgi:hypothetical protein
VTWKGVLSRSSLLATRFGLMGLLLAVTFLHGGGHSNPSIRNLVEGWSSEAIRS